MHAFRRLSAGPTIPRQMRDERRALQSLLVARLHRAWFASFRVCLACMLLKAATLLLRLDLIEPRVAGRALDLGARLLRDAMHHWHA